MPLAIHPFDASRAPAVGAFNRRLAAAGSHWRFPEHPEPSWLARVNGSPVFQEFFVAADGDVVRGAYALQHRPAAIGGEVQPIASWYLPISEGAVDRRYALVAMQLLRDAIRREPALVRARHGWRGLASGSWWARCGCERKPGALLRAHRERHAFRAGGSLPQEETTGSRASARPGGGERPRPGSGRSSRKLALRRGPGLGAASVETVPEFGAWADELWQRCRTHYSFVAAARRRDPGARLPAAAPRFERLRLRARRRRRSAGPCSSAPSMQDSRIFGSLHVGRITDCFAAPEDAGVVIRAAADTLAVRGVDLMLSNQLHRDWREALRRNAFLTAPSNHVFAPTAPLAERIHAIDPELRSVHLNRGDGDGPWGEIRNGAWAMPTTPSEGGCLEKARERYDSRSSTSSSSASTRGSSRLKSICSRRDSWTP